MFLLSEIVFNVAPTSVVIRFGDFPSLDTFQTECMAPVSRQSNRPHHTRPFTAMRLNVTEHMMRDVVSHFMRNGNVQLFIVMIFEVVGIDGNEFRFAPKSLWRLIVSANPS